MNNTTSVDGFNTTVERPMLPCLTPPDIVNWTPSVLIMVAVVVVGVVFFLMTIVVRVYPHHLDDPSPQYRDLGRNGNRGNNSSQHHI